MPEANCTEYTDIRLVGGLSENEGQLEFCIDQTWYYGVFCYYGWDNIDASVVCRQLDLQSGV